MKDWYDGVVGTTVRLFPGGLEVEVIVQNEAGFETYRKFIPVADLEPRQGQPA